MIFTTTYNVKNAEAVAYSGSLLMYSWPPLSCYVLTLLAACSTWSIGELSHIFICFGWTNTDNFFVSPSKCKHWAFPSFMTKVEVLMNSTFGDYVKYVSIFLMHWNACPSWDEAWIFPRLWGTPLQLMWDNIIINYSIHRHWLGFSELIQQNYCCNYVI